MRRFSIISRQSLPPKIIAKEESDGAEDATDKKASGKSGDDGDNNSAADESTTEGDVEMEDVEEKPKEGEELKNESEEEKEKTMQIPRMKITCVDRAGNKTEVVLEGDEIPDGKKVDNECNQP